MLSAIFFARYVLPVPGAPVSIRLPVGGIRKEGKESEING